MNSGRCVQTTISRSFSLINIQFWQIIISIYETKTHLLQTGASTGNKILQNVELDYRK